MLPAHAQALGALPPLYGLFEFHCWLCDRRCWPGGQGASLSGGFGNSLTEVPGVTQGVALKVWEFSEEKYITCVLQMSRLACTFIILVEE